MKPAPPLPICGVPQRNSARRGTDPEGADYVGYFCRFECYLRVTVLILPRECSGQAVRELGVKIDLVLGSPIGALNGAFIAAGTPPEELARLWCEMSARHLMRWNWKGLFRPSRAGGLDTLDPLRKFLRSTLRAPRFEDLALPLMITTTDLQLGKAVHLNGPGDLIEPLVASLNLPFFFPPVRIRDHQFVDGRDREQRAARTGAGARRAARVDERMPVLQWNTRFLQRYASGLGAQSFDCSRLQIRNRPPTTGQVHATSRCAAGVGRLMSACSIFAGRPS